MWSLVLPNLRTTGVITLFDANIRPTVKAIGTRDVDRTAQQVDTRAIATQRVGKGAGHTMSVSTWASAASKCNVKQVECSDICGSSPSIPVVRG